MESELYLERAIEHEQVEEQLWILTLVQTHLLYDFGQVNQYRGTLISSFVKYDRCGN